MSTENGIVACTPKEYNRSMISGHTLEALEKRMTFGTWLKEKRTARRQSLDDLAELTDYSKSYIHRLERDLPHPDTGALPQPSRKFVEALAPALDVPISEALAAAGYAPASAPPATTVEDDLAEMERRFGAKIATVEDVVAIRQQLGSIESALARLLAMQEKKDDNEEKTNP